MLLLKSTSRSFNRIFITAVAKLTGAFLRYISDNNCQTIRRKTRKKRSILYICRKNFKNFKKHTKKAMLGSTIEIIFFSLYKTWKNTKITKAFCEKITNRRRQNLLYRAKWLKLDFFYEYKKIAKEHKKSKIMKKVLIYV